MLAASVQQPTWLSRRDSSVFCVGTDEKFDVRTGVGGPGDGRDKGRRTK